MNVVGKLHGQNVLLSVLWIASAMSVYAHQIASYHNLPMSLYDIILAVAQSFRFTIDPNSVKISQMQKTVELMCSAPQTGAFFFIRVSVRLVGAAASGDGLLFVCGRGLYCKIVLDRPSFVCGHTVSMSVNSDCGGRLYHSRCCTKPAHCSDWCRLAAECFFYL